MHQITTSLNNINVIKRQDVPAMQEILQQHSLIKEEQESQYVFPNKTEYEKFLRNIDLPVFLGAPSYQKFVCPFCGKPEGYISYYDDEERWTFRCFAEKRSHNVIGMVQQISKCRYSQALTYINRVYNITYADGSQLSKAITHNITLLSDSAFETEYPYTVRYLKKSYFSLLKAFYQSLHTVNNDPIHSKDGTEVIILTVAETRQMLNIPDKRARTFLRWIALLGYIDAVRIDELCGEEIARLERISGYGQHEFASVYRIKLLDTELLAACEERAKELLELRLTKGNMTLKTIRAVTSEHKEDYSIVSPNFKAWRRNRANLAAENAIRLYSGVLRQEMARSGYILEKDIVQSIPVEHQMPYGREFNIHVAWKEVRSAVIEYCGWKCVSANRDLLKRLGMENRQLSGNIIVPAEMVFSAEEAVGAVLNEIALYGYTQLAKHIPSSKQNRKAFRDMLTACGIKSVRLNDTYRKQYGIRGKKGCIDILIDANDIQNKDKA